MRASRYVLGLFILLLWSCTTPVVKQAKLPPMTPSSDTVVPTAPPAAVAATSLPPLPAALPYAPVLEKLQQRGVPQAFIQLLATHPKVRFDEKFTRINVLGTARKPDYSHFYNKQAVKRCIQFLKQHDSLLRAVEQRYRVPKEIIVAILYVETKLGQYTGKHHIPSVFLSVAMADDSVYLAKNRERLRTQFQGSPTELAALERKLDQRSRRKAQWALQELEALSQLYLQQGIDVFSLYGSWAGAFGYAQFLPSSFLQWAVDGNQDGHIDLFSVPDAAHSIAVYLKEHGWGKAARQQRKAIYAYNHSRDYVTIIAGTMLPRYKP